MFLTFRQVSSSSCEVTEHILQIGTEVIESEESTQYAEAASGFGKWKYVKDAAKRHPTRQVSAAVCRQASFDA